MNYQCGPDLDPLSDLTPSALRLFQRFRQTADTERVLNSWDEQVRRHLRLCELTILYHAYHHRYWCELPNHPVGSVSTQVYRSLTENGFKIEWHRVGSEEQVEIGPVQKKNVPMVVVRSFTTVSWRDLPPDDTDTAEWRRREALEDAELKANPPKPISKIANGEVDGGDAIWAALIDREYLVEVQRIGVRVYLCLFDANGACIHIEETHAYFGAMFGPDVANVQEWQDRAITALDAFKKRSHP